MVFTRTFMNAVIISDGHVGGAHVQQEEYFRSHLTILSSFLPDRKFNYHHCITSASLLPPLTRRHSSEGNFIAFHSLTWNRILLGPLCTELHSEVTTSL